MNSPFDLIRLYQFPPGRRELALSILAARAAERDLPSLAQAADAAVAFERDAAEQRRKWVAWRVAASRATGQARMLDPALDRTVAAIASMAESWVQALPEDDPQAQAAQRVLAAAYPQGVSAITNQTYPEQLALVTTLVELLGSPEMVADVQAIGAASLVPRLAQLTEQFRGELSITGAQSPVTTEQMMANQATGQTNLLAVVAQVLGLAAKAPEVAQYLLVPVLEQQAALAAQFRARRRRTDVDPATGDEVTDDMDGAE